MTKKSAKTTQVLKKGSKKIKKFSRLQGMRDVMPKDYKYWKLINKKIEDLGSYYGFQELKIPTLERAVLYEASTGKNSDIVSKKLYTFTDKGGDRVAMIPDATPGIVRAIIDKGIPETQKTQKLFWRGSLFRFETPQSKNLREQHHFNFDCVGEASPVVEAQLLLIAYNFFRELQISTQVQINSIGCSECREEYVKKLSAFYKERGKRSKLCNNCKKNFTKDPFLLLSCDEEECEKIKEDAPQMIDFLCDKCKNHFITVLEYLDELNIPYNLSPFMTRGIDYYSGTVFEFIPFREDDDSESDSTRKIISLGGGGRYDELFEKMGSTNLPACGFGVNIHKVIQKIRENNIPIKRGEDDVIFLIQLGEDARKKSFLIFEDMRKAGYKVRQMFTENTLQVQLEEAKTTNAKYSLILGQKEFLDNTIILRDMESGTQEVIDQKKIYPEIDKRIASDKIT